MQIDCFPDAVANWEKKPIAALAVANPGYLVENGREYPFVEMSSVGENFAGIRKFDWRRLEASGLSRFRTGDTLFAKITPCPENGKIAFVENLPGEMGLGSTEFIVLSPRCGTDPRFLFHLLCCDAVRGRAAARMEGSTGRQRVPEEVFTRRLLVPCPPAIEQAAIARILDAADEAIVRSQVAVDRAEQLRQSLLSEVFERARGAVRRDVITASAGGRFSAGGMPSAWRLSTVGDEFNLQTGFTLNAGRRTWHRKHRYLRVANVQRDRLDLSDIQELEAADAELEPRKLCADDLLVVEGHADRMQIGRCARVTAHAAGMTFQNHLFRLRTRGDVLPAFGCLWLNSDYAQQFWNARCATSSGLNTINQRLLKRLVVPVPQGSEQEAIATLVAKQRRHLEALKVKRRQLDLLKAALLYDLLTGRVRVPVPPEATAP